MKNIILTTAAFMLFTGSALAAGSHSGGHDGDVKSDDHNAEMAVGEAGKRADASKTVVVQMKETDDGDMIYEPNSLDVKKGQTIHFVVKNKGELVHEFVLDNHSEIMEHKEIMAKFPEMEHDDPNSIRLEPGKTGNIVWKFTNAGKFEFACLIPGHYEAGMKGDLSVAQ
tara:strand:- start:3188 stop:3694 length:507 start_codon:yes stop_codon:yes gene_type:complete